MSEKANIVFFCMNELFESMKRNSLFHSRLDGRRIRSQTISKLSTERERVREKMLKMIKTHSRELCGYGKNGIVRI